MFPDIRLMIAAVMATIVGISCGLGLLAVFRINHDPYARLPSAGPPLQLVFGNAAPAPVTDATTAPFGVRFQSQAPQPVSAREPATEPPPLPSSSDNATMAPPSPTAPDSETTQDAVANAVAESAVEQTALAE